MSTANLAQDLASALPGLRGRQIAGQPLADITWFRVGGPAEVLFTPADEADLAPELLRHIQNLLQPVRRTAEAGDHEPPLRPVE